MGRDEYLMERERRLVRGETRGEGLYRNSGRLVRAMPDVGPIPTTDGEYIARPRGQGPCDANQRPRGGLTSLDTSILFKNGSTGTVIRAVPKASSKEVKQHLS